MTSLSLNGFRIHYLRRPAKGPDLVLVHGLATNLAFWYLKIYPLLAQRYNLTLYDLRGHGRSEMPSSGYTTAEMAEDLNALLEHEGLRRVHLVGHSYGGAIALHYTVLHPERVTTLTLADSRIQALQPAKSSFQPDITGNGLVEQRFETNLKQLEFSARDRLQNGSQRITGDLFAMSDQINTSTRTAQRWLELLRTTTLMQDLNNQSVPNIEQLRIIRQPLLAIYGKNSHCLPSCLALKHYLPHVKVVIVPRAGHFHPLTRPTFFTQNLDRFLGQVSEVKQ